MPKVLERDGYRFSFFSNEGNEPAHVHVDKGDCAGKVWLVPEVKVAGLMRGCKPKEAKKIERLVREHAELLKAKWDEYSSRRTG